MSLTASVIGGVNLDVTGFSFHSLIPRDSNPGSIRFSPGGVGRNIAEQLVVMGASARLFTALSRDAQGQMLLESCAARGIDASFALRVNAPTSCYLSIHNSDGDMALAINDMQLIDEITPDYVKSRLDEILRADVCVIDANLRADTLAFIAENVTLPIVADPVSTVKSAKLAPILPRLAAVKPNLLEAECITGRSAPEEAARTLLKRGAARVVISLGERGAYYADAQACGYCAPGRVFVCQTNGAGDAMCAGVALGTAMGKSAEECTLMGLAASERLLSSR